MKTPTVSWRLSSADRATLKKLATQHGISQVDVIRLLLGQAQKKGLFMTTEAPSHSTPLKERRAILSWMTGETLYVGEGDLRTVLQTAILAKARLVGARLVGARLEGARLEGAQLEGAQLEGANLARANLARANLARANLEGASLVGARLDGARLVGARLDTGDVWEDYLAEVVPALLQAGGHALADCAAHWECHNWGNCPMAWAFDVHTLGEIPALYRPRAKQFVQLFDAALIPCPVPAMPAADAPAQPEGGK